MKTERIAEIANDYKKALKRLEEAINENPRESKVIIDGTIQRFEFTFELAWKLVKAVLNYYGTEANSPRSAIKEGYKMELIKNGERWIDMLEDRNLTSHIYDEKDSLRIYKKVKKRHFKDLKALEEAVSKLLKEIK